MERKIGETFWFDDKLYEVIEALACKDCSLCNLCREHFGKRYDIAGVCTSFSRNDRCSVSFKEIKNTEIKDNKLTIDIPDGMEIDTENCDLKNGIIKFKKKRLTYVNIMASLDSNTKLISTTYTNCKKVIAISKLLDIANYYNGDWKPNWSNKKEGKFYISYNFIHNIYFVIEDNSNSIGAIVFKHKEDAQEVIDNPNFREILNTIFKN